MQEDELNLIENYCEKLVLSEIKHHLGEIDNPVYVADVACVALNTLDPVYVRKSTNMEKRRSQHHLLELTETVKIAVDKAFLYVGCESDIHRESDLFS